LAHAGERNGGPGPGWLGPEPRAHAEPCAGGCARGLGRALAGRARMRARALSPVLQLGRARAFWAGCAVCKRKNSAYFLFPESFFPIEFD
jgi:hypothetical protein